MHVLEFLEPGHQRAHGYVIRQQFQFYLIFGLSFALVPLSLNSLIKPPVASYELSGSQREGPG